MGEQRNEQSLGKVDRIRSVAEKLPCSKAAMTRNSLQIYTTSYERKGRATPHDYTTPSVRLFSVKRRDNEAG